MGLPVAPFEEIHERFPPQTSNVYRNRIRQDGLCVATNEETRTKGYELAHYVSSRAFVPNNLRRG